MYRFVKQSADEPAVRQFNVDAFDELGYRVLEADGAAAALRMLDAHPEIALLSTDVVMPEINGAKLAKEALRCKPGLRILFTTGYTRNAVVRNGVLDAGVELIGKPFTIEELATKVRAVPDGPVKPESSSPLSPWLWQSRRMLQLHALQRLHVGPIDLTLADGECVAIAGRSGAGKSLLLRAIADLDPHAGDAALDGQPCAASTAPAWRRCVTYVPAESGWWAEQVEAHFEPSADLPARLLRVGLAPDTLGWPVSRLSTGERQRLAVLRAMRPHTRVLLLDEPTSGLDAETTATVEALLQEHLARGTSIVLVTHDAAQAGRLSHRRFVLNDGALVPA